ncbi:MAG: RluA family pseudouridine synthase, partial [Dysgonamonadaceae bacterium]|nr:RluA family pseudouridine synthase [Dysgonamonadaceae bacterium]
MLKKDFDEINDLWEEGDDEIVASEESKQYEHYRFIADKGQSLLRIDKFLSDRIEGVSRNRIQQAAEAGCILVNNVPVKSSYKVKPMDVISIVMDKPRHEIEIIPEDIPLNIVYEDNDLMVVNKPAGMVVHPGYGNYTGTLLNAVAYYLNYEQGMHLDDPRVGMVHRIDKDTSGLLLIAKTPEA